MPFFSLLLFHPLKNRRKMKTNECNWSVLSNVTWKNEYIGEKRFFFGQFRHFHWLLYHRNECATYELRASYPLICSPSLQYSVPLEPFYFICENFLYRSIKHCFFITVDLRFFCSDLRILFFFAHTCSRWWFIKRLFFTFQLKINECTTSRVKNCLQFIANYKTVTAPKIPNLFMIWRSEEKIIDEIYILIHVPKMWVLFSKHWQKKVCIHSCVE